MKKMMIAVAAAILTVLAASAVPAADKTPKIKTTVNRHGDKVWLTGIDYWSVGEKESSLQAAQEAAMKALGEQVDYDYLVGVSGLAFRMQVFAKELCPSSPHAHCGYGCADRSAEFIPWKMEPMPMRADGSMDRDKANKMVVESIDRGTPVLYGNEEDGLIIGYQKSGREWICRNPFGQSMSEDIVNTRDPWGMGFLTGRKTETPDKVKLERESLEQALKMAEMTESNGYYLGQKAWDSYIEQLQALDKADEKTVKDRMLGNAWIYECLVSYRRSAASYLRRIAPDFPEKARPHLLKAADLYESVWSKVLTDKDHNCLSVAPYGWSLKPGQKWDAGMRAAQIDRLRKAFPLERQALRAIAKALEAAE